MFIGHMRSLARWLGYSVLVFTLTFHPYLVQAQMPLSRPVMNQILADMVLDRFLAEYSRFQTVGEYGQWLAEHFPSRDRDFIKKQLSGKRKLPKLDRLNRGLALTVEKDRYTIEIVNASRGILRFNERYTWVYNPKSSLSQQFEVFRRALERKQTSSLDLILPEAHAWAWIGTVVAFLVGAGLAPITTDVITKFVYPWLKSFYCDGKTPQTSYHTAEFCDSYFRWKDNNRPKLPAAEPVPDASKAVEEVEVKTKCRSEGDPDIVTEVESPDKSVKTRRTIKFGSGNRPTHVIEELIHPPSDVRLVYTLDEKAGVVMVESNCGEVKCPSDKAVFLSRKKEHMELMTPEKIKAIDNFDEGLKMIIPIIEQCDAKAKAVVEKAEESALLLKTKVEEVEKGTALEIENPVTGTKEKVVN